MILHDFQPIEPRFRTAQTDLIDWLVGAHAQAQACHDKSDPPVAPVSANSKEPRFPTLMTALFRRYGCSSERIGRRGHDIADFTHTDWPNMELFRFNTHAQGPTMSERSTAFRQTAARVCNQVYGAGASAPAHLIHVTCTGYLSPSCAQELVAHKGWHEQTVVTHAYHMGCSAALPAIRLAQGFLAVAPDRRVDILHTEVCSLHLRADDHSPEQLIVQSLFADGFIAYSAVADRAHLGTTRGLEQMAAHEVLVPDTAAAITWDCGEWGMRMGLSREVPETICRVLPGFVTELSRRAGISSQELLAEAIFAVHPGGPKIIDRVQALLGLTASQISHSAMILRERGNMSSATLPHIWEAILADSAVATGVPVVSLAFGPGLCVSGAVFRLVAAR